MLKTRLNDRLIKIRISKNKIFSSLDALFCMKSNIFSSFQQ
ncbi:hypothetical protein QUI_1961 [Clostridioides difficile P59]|nr:hypothetical protein QUI_1961 [Clostridioides difficile P59]